MRLKDKYLQVDHDYIEEIEKLIFKKVDGKVIYCENDITELHDIAGKIDSLQRTEQGQFIGINDKKIRLDRIVTLFGKPGPRYDEYDRYANVCFTCENLDPKQ